MTRTRRSHTGQKISPCKFGAHMSIAGGYEHALLAAHALGCQTVQLFTKNNNQWSAPRISEDQSALFRKTREETGIVDPVAHTSYLINLASPDDVLWKKSIEAMVHEVQRCSQLGIADLVVHPGAHAGSGEQAGLWRVARALDQIRDRTGELGVTIDLETTAGQGTTIGHRFEHLQAILELVADSQGLGICLDSCHIFAAGYSLDAPERYDEVIEQLIRTVGIDRLRVWHLNDSCRECGSRVDRHAGIGTGRMGLEPFRSIVKDPRFRHLPMILETPKGKRDGEELDARNLRILRRLAAS